MTLPPENRRAAMNSTCPAADQSTIACSPSDCRDRATMMSVTVSVISRSLLRSVGDDAHVSDAARLELVEHVHLMLHVEPSVDAQENLLVRACEHQLPDALRERLEADRFLSKK